MQEKQENTNNYVTRHFTDEEIKELLQKRKKKKKLKKKTKLTKYQKRFNTNKSKSSFGLGTDHNKNYDAMQEFKATHRNKKLNKLKHKDYYGFNNLKLRKII